MSSPSLNQCISEIQHLWMMLRHRKTDLQVIDIEAPHKILSNLSHDGKWWAQTVWVRIKTTQLKVWNCRDLMQKPWETSISREDTCPNTACHMQARVASWEMKDSVRFLNLLIWELVGNTLAVTESTNLPRYVIYCVGTSMDLSQFTMIPNSWWHCGVMVSALASQTRDAGFNSWLG